MKPTRLLMYTKRWWVAPTLRQTVVVRRPLAANPFEFSLDRALGAVEPIGDLAVGVAFQPPEGDLAELGVGQRCEPAVSRASLSTAASAGEGAEASICSRAQPGQELCQIRLAAMSRTVRSSARRSWIKRVTEASGSMMHLQSGRAITRRTPTGFPTLYPFVTTRSPHPTPWVGFPRILSCLNITTVDPQCKFIQMSHHEARTLAARAIDIGILAHRFRQIQGHGGEFATPAFNGRGSIAACADVRL